MGVVQWLDQPPLWDLQLLLDLEAIWEIWSQRRESWRLLNSWNGEQASLLLNRDEVEWLRFVTDSHLSSRAISHFHFYSFISPVQKRADDDDEDNDDDSDSSSDSTSTTSSASTTDDGFGRWVSWLTNLFLLTSSWLERGCNLIQIFSHFNPCSHSSITDSGIYNSGGGWVLLTSLSNCRNQLWLNFSSLFFCFTFVSLVSQTCMEPTCPNTSKSEARRESSV